jgi:hypothetical protein
MIFSRPRRQIAEDGDTSPPHHRTRYEELALATCTRPPVIGMTNPLHAPRHLNGSLLPGRAAFRHWGQMGWKSLDDSTVTARHAMVAVVDICTISLQRKTNPATSQNHLPSHRQFILRIGSGAK